MVAVAVADVYSALILLVYWLNEKCKVLVKAMAKLKRCQPFHPVLTLTPQWKHVRNTIAAGRRLKV